MQWGSNDPLKRHGIWDNDTTILLEDVAALVDTYDEDKLAIPSITPSNSLGKNWGLGTIEFCRAFVEQQFAQVKAETPAESWIFLKSLAAQVRSTPSKKY